MAAAELTDHHVGIRSATQLAGDRPKILCDDHVHDLDAKFYDTRMGTERAKRNHVQHLHDP